jgi:tRNA(fMet)-specific endonuclease VapC
MAKAGPVIVDTMVFSWRLAATPVGQLYGPHLQGRPLILAAQTVAELRALALINGWGGARRAALDERIARLRVAGVDEELANTYARLKADCRQQGHGLGDKVHDGDRWIAATAVRYEIPLVSHDGIFKNAPGLDLITELGNE